ncbi:MAG: FtsQ-type POTRA domain-containing protein [Patescibacteria group bacterium]
MTDRHYRKPHRYKKRKPILRKKFLALCFLILIAACAIFYGLFLWKIFWVEKIIVSGEQKTTKEEIESLVSKRLENAVLFFKTKSILAIDRGQIEKDILEAFPGISEVKISKSFFDAISVQITERTAVVLWCENDRCFLLDNQGVIFEPVSETDSETKLSLTMITKLSLGETFALGQTVIAKDELAQILEIKSQLTETVKIAVDNAVVSDGRLDIETAEGWLIRFNLKGDLDWQMTELKLALEKQISPEKRKNLEYIDLRFSRVYYK